MYQANNAYGETMINQGMQNAIGIDGTDYAVSNDSPFQANAVVRNTVFWIGTLGSGSHTIEGRFASLSSGNTVTVSNRVLLIYILNGNTFLYDDDPTTSTSASATLGTDPAASFTFTPSGSCKALVLYNISNSGATESNQGKKAAISIGGADYSQAEESPGTANFADSVFTAWALSLSTSSTTVTGRFAANVAATVTINRRQLGVLLFDDSTLLDNNVTSNTAVTTTSSTLVDDGQATISRTTTDARELLVVAMGTKRYSTASNNYGQCYGIKVNANDRASSRGSSGAGSTGADSAATAYAESLAAASHTIKGRFSNNTGTNTAVIDSRRIVALWFPAAPGSTLLTFNSKYVVTSSTAVTTTSTSLQDDTQASQTFSLTASQTVLVIYQANNVHGVSMSGNGMQNAISVDAADTANSWDSPYDVNYCARNTVFWIGTLASGSHTIKGRFASKASGVTVTISNRVLLIYILDGNAFQYIDSSTTQTTSSTSLGDDPAASFTFTPPGTSKALILYNISNSGATEGTNGKKAAINIGGTDYGQAEKSGHFSDESDSIFTVWALSLSASSTTVKGRFAANVAGTVTVHRRQLGILMFADSTLLDTVSSDTQVSTTSSSLVDDAQATISRTTTDGRELLVVAMGTKRYGTSSSYYGECYGTKVDTNERTNSRGSANSSTGANSAATAWAETLAAAAHTIQGRFSNNSGTNSAKIDSRRIVALWFPSGLFQYRRPITISDAMTPSSCGSTVSSFPILVSYTDATLKTAANGGHVQNASGNDIIFRAEDSAICTDSGNPAPCTLDHEIEKYDGGTSGGTVIAWVRIPTLSHGSGNKTIYMYYGNSAITTATANPTGVWSNGYVGVWHLKETSAPIKNSTANTGLDGTVTGSPTFNATPQIIDGNVQFISGSHIGITDPGTGSVLDFGTGNSITLSAWVRPSSVSGWSTFLIKGDSDGGCCNGNYAFQADAAKLSFNYYNGSAYQVFESGNVLATGNWYNVAATYTFGTAGSAALYLNGNSQTGSWTSGTGTTAPVQSNYQLWLGNDTSGEFLNGILDEVRISNVPRDACWVGTEYNSMNAPATVGAEVQNAPTLVEMASLDATWYPGRGVLVSWRTGFEVDNLGFHVYREVDGQRIRVTPSLVAGSALFAGAGTALTAGRSYAWWDSSPVAGASYWLEEWELSGARRWHGPVSVQPGAVGVQAQGLAVPPSGGPVQASSALLAGFGQAVSPSPPQGVRRKLRQALGMAEERRAVQWGLASRPAVKLLVSEEGWTRVSRDELVQAGLDPSVDPSRLQLFVDGLQAPILVDVRQHGVFASGDGIEFYGEGLDTPSTAARVYWLVVGSGAGLRIRGGESEAGSGRRVLRASRTEVERADRTVYIPSLFNGDAENFFGAVVTTTPVSQSVRVQHVDQGGPGELVVRLQGLTAGAHRVGVGLNGVRVGTMAWAEMVVGELAVPLGTGMIAEGDNQVTLAAEGGEGDVSAVESIRVRYQHTWDADGEALEFSLGGYQEVTIGGFRSSQVRVVDITNPVGGAGAACGGRQGG